MASDGDTRAPDDGGPRRLHPISLLFLLGRALRVVAVPMLLVFLARSDEPWWISLFVLPGVVQSVVHYVVYRYRFEGEELVVQGGLLFRFERHIPYARIQNIDLVQGPVHRLFGVADVRIETGGDAREEAHMQVLALAAVDDMRRRVAAGRRKAGRASEVDAGDAQPAEEAEVVLRMGARDLLLFGLVSNRGMTVVLGALGVAESFGLFDREFDDEQLRALEDLDAGLSRGAVVLFVLALLVLVRALSVGWAFVNLNGFELRRVGDDLQTRCGLFTRHVASIPRARVQVVTVRETLLQRLVGRASVKVDTAGGSALEERAATRRWIAPFVRRERLGALVELVAPGVRLEGLSWRGPARGATRRLARRGCALALLVAGGLAAWVVSSRDVASDAPPAGALRWDVLVPGLTAAVLCAWAVVDARLRARVAAYAAGDGTFAVREGVWTRTTRIVRHAKGQSVTLSTSPFDRRWEMAGVSVDAAGTDRPVAMRWLARDEAAGLHALLVRAVGATDFRW